MKSKQHSVAVVVLTWNDWSNTVECLESLFKNNYSNFDIILIDNNSEQFHYDKILDWCSKKKIHINFINNKSKLSPFKLKKNNNLFIYKSSEVANYPYAKNLGIARGYNKGLNFSLKKNYDFIVRLDCDFIVPKNLIRGMVSTLITNPSAVAMSPKVYYHIKKKTKLIWWTNLNFTKNYFRFHRTGKNNNRRVLDNGQFKGIITSDSICGCCVMFRTKSLKQALKIHPSRKNILDEDFFFGPEDMELSHRIKRYW